MVHAGKQFVFVVQRHYFIDRAAATCCRIERKSNVSVTVIALGTQYTYTHTGRLCSNVEQRATLCSGRRVPFSLQAGKKAINSAAGASTFPTNEAVRKNVCTNVGRE